MEYEEENRKLIEFFLERSFFRAWRTGKPENFINLEVFWNTRCNLACKYCYLKRFGNLLYPEFDEKQAAGNIDFLVEWLRRRGFRPKIEFFSGEPLIQPACYEQIQKLATVARTMVIPTNFTFILSERLTAKVEQLLASSDCRIFLSASFDGKYCEHARPFKSGVELRDDAYYDRCFEFAVKHDFGFHPMIAPQNIENWIENFLWFQEQFEKFNHPWWHLYLLEVRNPEWSKRDLKHLDEFLTFLVTWTLRKTGNANNFFDFLFQKRGFNILSSPFTTVGRGIGCSIQSTLTIRAYDLAIVPCHRLSYPQFLLGHLTKKGIEIRNPELWIVLYSFDRRCLPYCESCPFKELCSGGCLGAQYESIGDPFTPHPNVCQLEAVKIRSIISALEEHRILNRVLRRVRPEKRLAIEVIRNEL